MVPEYQKKAQKKYDATNTVMISIKLNRTTDADIIEKLDEQDSRQGYIKELIRKDLTE